MTDYAVEKTIFLSTLSNKTTVGMNIPVESARSVCPLSQQHYQLDCQTEQSVGDRERERHPLTGCVVSPQTDSLPCKEFLVPLAQHHWIIVEPSSMNKGEKKCVFISARCSTG